MSRNRVLWLVVVVMMVVDVDGIENWHVDPWRCNDLCFKAKDGICDVRNLG